MKKVVAPNLLLLSDDSMVKLAGLKDLPTAHSRYQACINEITKILERRWLIINETGKQSGLYPCAEVFFKDITVSPEYFIYVNCLLLESGWAMIDETTVPQGWEKGYQERLEKARSAQRGLWANTSPAK